MGSRKLKTPKISRDTKILSFDLEANGLHGPAFAVGAAIVNVEGEVIDEFSARCPIEGKVDEWVEENVIPVIEDMPIKQSNYKELREAFWQWFVATEPGVDYVLVSNGYPVEYRFLLQCQEDNLEERYWQHPFPILDLTSLMLWVGITTTSDKASFIKEFAAKSDGSQHNPVFDAKIAALAAAKALRNSIQSMS